MHLRVWSPCCIEPWLPFAVVISCRSSKWRIISLSWHWSTFYWTAGSQNTSGPEPLHFAIARLGSQIRAFRIIRPSFAVIKVDHPQLCALCRILQELSQMYRTLHFWEKAGTIRQWQFLGPVFDGEELRIQSDPLPCWSGEPVSLALPGVPDGLGGCWVLLGRLIDFSSSISAESWCFKVLGMQEDVVSLWSERRAQLSCNLLFLLEIGFRATLVIKLRSATQKGLKSIELQLIITRETWDNDGQTFLVQCCRRHPRSFIRTAGLNDALSAWAILSGWAEA